MAGRRTVIRRKLMTAIMGTSALVLVLSCAAFVTYEYVSFRKNLARGLITRADILAANSTAALAFQNEEDAAGVLSALRRDPRMVAACLYDKDGVVFATYPAGAPAAGFPAARVAPDAVFERGHCHVFRPVEEAGVWLGTLYLQSDLLLLAQRFRFYALLVVIVIAGSLLAAFALSAQMQRRIADPVLSLAATARHISEHKDFAVRAPIVSADEIGLLSESFNGMLDEIQRRDAALRRNEARTRAILESALAGIITIDQDGRIVEFNPAAERIFGYARSEAVGATMADLIIPPRLRQAHADGIRRYLRTGEDHVLGRRIEMPAFRKDGTEFPVELSITRIEQEGAPTFTGFVSDITERKRAEDDVRKLNAELERRVAERTAELERTNNELEAFAYSVSHDLRAPLRSVDGFSQAMIEDYSPQLPDEGRRFLGEIRAGAQRMGALIDDLLAFSRLSRLPLSKRVVPMTALVREVLAELETQQRGRRIALDVGSLPSCLGDRALLRQVWVNLLSNALKYTRKRAVAEISVGCRQGDGEAVYFVRDNGTGFDMRYAGKLFGVFQRLHRAEEYEGTGVGLAIVHRVVARHGGRVWAEAAVDKGATFYFTVEAAARHRATAA